MCTFVRVRILNAKLQKINEIAYNLIVNNIDLMKNVAKSNLFYVCT